MDRDLVERARSGDQVPMDDGKKVVVVSSGRGDAWPGAARFGGAVQLLKDMTATLDLSEAH